MFHNQFLSYSYIFGDTSDAFKTKSGHYSINLTDAVCSLSKAVKT